MSLLGTTTGNCGCSLLDRNCQCKKSEEWQDTYKWSYGYTPLKSSNSFATATSDFPTGIQFQDTVLPAKLTLTAYDTFLTRLSCVTKKAYELKEPTSIKFTKSNVYFTSNPTFKRASGTHACMYSTSPEGEEPIECRYMPGVPFESFNILEDFPSSADKGTITAYPVKNKVTCNEIKSNPSLITKDIINTIVLCLEAAK